MPHVLIIDDEPGIRFALRRFFERRQWTVTEAGDGESALAELLPAADGSSHDGPAIDLVISDLNLPGISGEQLIARLESDRPALVDRVILTTGDDIAGAPPGSILARHPHLLQKPFDLAGLGQLVSTIIGTP